MSFGRNASLTPDDVLWLLNEGKPVELADLEILVVIDKPKNNSRLNLGDVLLVDRQGDEFLAPVKPKLLDSGLVRIQRRPRDLPADTRWTTTDPKAAWALGKKVKQPHDAGHYQWDGKRWNIVDLKGRKRRTDQDVVYLHEYPSP
jgi:hypothetical protein